jgi:hypothetical protein
VQLIFFGNGVFAGAGRNKTGVRCWPRKQAAYATPENEAGKGINVVEFALFDHAAWLCVFNICPPLL